MFRPTLYVALAIILLSEPLWGQENPQLLHVTARSGNPEIMLIQPDVDPAILAGHGASDIFPAWSRNGQRIAFSSNRSGIFQIHTMDGIGGGELQLSLMKRGDSLSPSWSPSGDFIVYQHGRDHDWDLWVIDADGGAWRRIVHNGWQPDWSPPRETGERIVFVSALHDAGMFLFTCNPDGSDIRRIHRLHNTINLVDPIWSRDAERIAFTDRDQKSHEIFTCGPLGGDVRQLTTLGRKNVYPTWSADGTRVYFLHQRGDKLWQWMSVDVETRQIEAFDAVPAEGFIRGGRASWH